MSRRRRSIRRIGCTGATIAAGWRPRLLRDVCWRSAAGSTGRWAAPSIRCASARYVIGYPNTTYDKYDFDRRSVYLPVMRSDVYAVFQAFDFADPSTASGERATTTVAPQALFLMNGKIVREAVAPSGRGAARRCETR